jgi:hypothetical protein
MLTLTDEQLDWLTERIPDHARSPDGGRPPVEKRKAIAGIFWLLGNGAKWKNLPCRFGSKSAVHRGFMKWVENGVFEAVIRDAGGCASRGDRDRRGLTQDKPPSYNAMPVALFARRSIKCRISPGASLVRFFVNGVLCKASVCLLD